MFSNSNGLGFTQLPYCIHHVDTEFRMRNPQSWRLPNSTPLGPFDSAQGKLTRAPVPTRTSDSLHPHRHLHARLLRKLLRLVVSRVYVPNHAHSRIGCQHALDALGHHVGAVGNRDLSGMKRVA